MTIKWTKDYEDMVYSSHTGIDEVGNVYHESANQETVSVTTPDGKHGIGWTASEALDSASLVSFLICPVRGHDISETEAIVKDIEQSGYTVHWPPRDTNQNDDTGLRICMDNLDAIKNADVVHIIWDGKSQGCLFDLGMAFALGKQVIPISLPEATETKSFQNMITAYSKIETP